MSIKVAFQSFAYMTNPFHHAVLVGLGRRQGRNLLGHAASLGCHHLGFMPLNI